MAVGHGWWTLCCMAPCDRSETPKDARTCNINNVWRRFPCRRVLTCVCCRRDHQWLETAAPVGYTAWTWWMRVSVADAREDDADGVRAAYAAAVVSATA